MCAIFISGFYYLDSQLFFKDIYNKNQDMSQITPFVKRMRTQGGTLYTFSSAVEDIGLNINERNNIVKMSHFALLEIPEVTAPTNIQQNKFNVLAINSGLKNYENEGSVKDGRVVIAESFENYALNLETNLLTESTYNPAILKTVSERVFWKWLKETGAVRWIKDVSHAGYWLEEADTDSSTGYNAVVKHIGEISAGSLRTDTFGTYNETYVLVPTSHGQTRVYFKQDYDDNYKSSMELGAHDSNLLIGRETYTQPHPDGLSLLAQYDMTDSSTTTGNWDMLVDVSDGAGYTAGWWYTAQGLNQVDQNWYITDASSVVIDSSLYNYKLKYDGASTIEFQRSNVDALGIEYNLDDLKTIFGDSTLTFDKMAIDDSVDDSFNFNAVLVYYTVYNNTQDKILATNLLGILFLDAPSGNTTGFPDMEITIPEITKYQSNSSGFGTAYSFRLNIKSDNMIDDTQATIFDESTSSQTALTSWSDVFANLDKSVSILNAHTGTINYITEQYMGISNNQSQQNDLISNLQYQVNGLEFEAEGTDGTISMFSDVTNTLVDTSIYQKDEWVGIFTSDPSFPFHVDGSMKTYDITIENTIRDTSGNVILGYGSPLQLGSSTNFRKVNIYTGAVNPAVYVDTSSNFHVDGSVSIIGDVSINGLLTVPGGILGLVKEASLGGSFYWTADGSLETTASGGAGTGNVRWANGALGTNNQLITAAGDGSIVSESQITFDGNLLNIDGSISTTGAISVYGNITGNNLSGTNTGDQSTVTNITLAGALPDSTTYPIIAYSATGDQEPKTSTGLRYSTLTGELIASSFNGAGTELTGTARSLTSGSTLGVDVALEYGNASFYPIFADVSFGVAALTKTSVEITFNPYTKTLATDTINVGDGSTLTPTYTFSGDNDTGFYWGGLSGQIAVTCDGSTNFLFDTSTFHARGNVVSYSSTPSDIRLKKDITSINDSLEKITSLEGIEYVRKRNNQKHTGFIAQDLEKILPGIIVETELLGEEGIFKTIKYNEIIPYLVEAIKEQQCQIDELKKEINDLK